MKALRSTRRASQAAFSLLELMVSATVFVLVSGAVVTTLMASTALNSTNRESVVAMQAAQSVLEALKGTAFDEIYVRHDGNPANDPASGVSPGQYFAVSALDLQVGDADGFAGSIEFPGGAQELREDVDDLELGMPRDLNGDGGVDALDHSADYRILPVRIVVEWRGKTGERRLELVSVLSEL